jgi:Asp-tRNA(Asn)/Glu-tRNA(Gln) amidotransferase A subunit family amidase
MTDPHRLSAVAAAEQIAKKQLTSVALVEDCLARIAAREPLVGAWEALDRTAVLAAARRADQSAPKSRLHGIPIAIKDIIDTADLPTAYGSPIYAGHRPAANALCVARLREAGAIVMGKTVTTEFAYFTPGKTANPHNLAHTPGGSSSGSAAAVADYMVPLSIGTQTAGSVIRPAAFCGVVGYKGTKDWLEMTGIIPFAPSLDTLGVFGRSVADVALFRAVLIDDKAAFAPAARAPHIGLCRTPQWSEASGALHAAIEEAVRRLAKSGATLREIDAPWQGDGLIEAQKTILSAEAVKSFAKEARDHGDKLSRRLSDLIEAGKKIDGATIDKAHALAAKSRQAHDALFGDVDVLLTPAAPGEAPKGLAATGDPVFNRGWTYLGAPCVSLPYGKGPAGLPLAIQLVGKRGADRDLVAAAAWIEGQLQ